MSVWVKPGEQHLCRLEMCAKEHLQGIPHLWTLALDADVVAHLFHRPDERPCNVVSKVFLDLL